jgi:hypothetical protein
MKFDITFISPTGHPDTYVAIEAENEQAVRDMKDSLLTAAGSFWPVDQWTIASVVPTPPQAPASDPTLMPMYYPSTDTPLTTAELVAKQAAEAEKAAEIQLAIELANPYNPQLLPPDPPV